MSLFDPVDSFSEQLGSESNLDELTPHSRSKSDLGPKGLLVILVVNNVPVYNPLRCSKLALMSVWELACRETVKPARS